MKQVLRSVIAGAALMILASQVLRADVQEIAPGTGLQSAVEIDTGADGICNTKPTGDDIQATPFGSGSPFQTEIKCGPDKIVATTAVGDDTQLLPLGSPCKTANTAVVDTGNNGIADSTAAGDDVQVIAVGTAPANSPCVLTGANGIADTSTVGGDDVRKITLGTAMPNTTVIRCGPNLIADTHANNDVPTRKTPDDVQVLAVGSACPNQNSIVVNSGPDGISTTRAEGPDLVLKALGPVHITIPKVKTPLPKSSVTKTVRVSVANVEFGALAPASRMYTLSVTDGSCPAGTVSNVDADVSSKSPGLQTSASVPRGGKVTGGFLATFHLEDITSVATNVPFRCAVNVEADVVDLALNGAPDDAVNTDNNMTPLDFEVVDKNDLP